MYYYYVLLDGRGAGWRVVGNALRAVHVRVKFFLRHRFPWKFPETVFFRASQISERISGNLDQSQGRTRGSCIKPLHLADLTQGSLSHLSMGHQPVCTVRVGSPSISDACLN